MAVVIGSTLAATSMDVRATDFTAGVVMSKMKDADRYIFVAGVVEGLAFSRYLRDGKKTDGMGCIYDWFYKDKSTIDTIYAAFQKYPEYMPGAIIDILVKKKCGE